MKPSRPTSKATPRAVPAADALAVLEAQAGEWEARARELRGEAAKLRSSRGDG